MFHDLNLSEFPSRLRLICICAELSEWGHLALTQPAANMLLSLSAHEGGGKEHFSSLTQLVSVKTFSVYFSNGERFTFLEKLV